MYMPAATESFGVTKRHSNSNLNLIHKRIDSHSIYRLEAAGQRNARR